MLYLFAKYYSGSIAALFLKNCQKYILLKLNNNGLPPVCKYFMIQTIFS